MFATGSRAFVPPIEGSTLPGVFEYRTIEDLASLKSYAPFCRRAAVPGGGLLGLEVAHALKQPGLETWAVERGSSLMARELDGEAILATTMQKAAAKSLMPGPRPWCRKSRPDGPGFIFAPTSGRVPVGRLDDQPACSRVSPAFVHRAY